MGGGGWPGDRGRAEKAGRSLLLFNPSSKLNGGDPVDNNERAAPAGPGSNYLRDNPGRDGTRRVTPRNG